MPQGLAIASSSLCSDSGSKPSFVMSSMSLSLSSKRMTIFSPNSVGRIDTRKSISLVPPSPSPNRILMRPSCGGALFGGVQLGHDLDARGDRVAELHRRRHHVVENPVDAEPPPELLLVRLDV